MRNELKADLECRMQNHRTYNLDLYKPVIEGIANENAFCNNVALLNVVLTTKTE